MDEGAKINERPVNWGEVKTARQQREVMKVNAMLRKHGKDCDETVHQNHHFQREHARLLIDR